MSGNKNYQSEIDAFRNIFGTMKDKKIVLYGIGRYTATLLAGVSDFNFVGLMDRDENNLGKVMYGLPVIDVHEAEKTADLVIINTAETYWHIIYNRIKNINIPVYFLNGEIAKDDVINQYEYNPYWNNNINELEEKIREYDVVSFDIFDTLIMRKIYLPQDVFKLVEFRLKKEYSIDIDFYKIRLETSLTCNDRNLSLDEVYREMNLTWQLPVETLELVRQLEINTEKSLCVPRKDMVALCNSVAEDKEVYLISDMYFSSEVIAQILKLCGVNNTVRIIISSEIKKNKKSGELWKYYTQNVLLGKKALHIGDNVQSDVKIPQSYGIDTYYVMSASKMLEQSSVSRIAPKICNLEESVFMGLIISILFNSPFALSNSKGKVELKAFHEMGYCLWGGVIYSFLLWLVEECRKNNINRLLFMSRDCYLIEKDYLFLKHLLKSSDWPDNQYFAISRRIVVVSSLKDKDKYDELLELPYNGSFMDFMCDRFDIKVDGDMNSKKMVNIPNDAEQVRKWMTPYQNIISETLGNEIKNYKSYLDSMDIGDTDAIVDLWFYGSNQFYLSKTLGKELKGFYFAVNKSEENYYNDKNKMIPCFQHSDDPLAKKCNIRRMDLFTESFFTAPYGMIKAVDENGRFICADEGINQNTFDKRELINSGICNFMKDYLDIFGKESQLDRFFVNDFFGEFADGNIDLSKELKIIFYYDNSFIRKREMPIYE